MNLAQSPIRPAPVAPINFSLPDLSKWEQTEDQQRIAIKKDLIADTLEQVKGVLAYPMTLVQIKELLPCPHPAIKDWITVWTNQGHFTRRRIGSTYLYSLGKGSE